MPVSSVEKNFFRIIVKYISIYRVYKSFPKNLRARLFAVLYIRTERLDKRKTVESSCGTTVLFVWQFHQCDFCSPDSASCYCFSGAQFSNLKTKLNVRRLILKLVEDRK